MELPRAAALLVQMGDTHDAAIFLNRLGQTAIDDRTRELAASLGARVVPVEGKGYGRALRGGFAAARGKYLVMADADGSYDFELAPRFVAQLRTRHDFVVGNRYRGGIAPGAKVVAITEIAGEHNSLIELRVAKEDVGKVIGKDGRTAQSMRTILTAVSTKLGRRAHLDIVD